jgi:hypothetical protein
MPTSYIHNPNIYTSSFVERYVHPKGNDNNSGLDWSNAYATVYGALVAMAAIPVKARLYIADNTNLHPDGIHGLWLTNDSALYTGSPYWLNSLPFGGTEFVGVGGEAGTNGGLAVTNSLVNNGMPALRLAGTSGAGFTFRNLIFQDRTEIGCDGNGNPGGDATHACSHLEFDHCAFSSNTFSGVASPAVISGYSFWMYFRHCEFTPNYYSDPNHGPYVGGLIDVFNASTHVATLHYPADTANFGVGTNVTVAGNAHTVTSIDSVNGFVGLDSNTGVTTGLTINRIPGNGVGDVCTDSPGTPGHVTMGVAGAESNYMVGDWVVFDTDYATKHQVTAINTSLHQLSFATVPSGVGHVLWQFPNRVRQPERMAVLLTSSSPGVTQPAGLMAIEHCYGFGGGIAYYAGSAWQIQIRDWTTESDGTIPIGPGVHMSIGSIAGYSILENCATADSPDVDVYIDGFKGYGQVPTALPYMSNLVQVINCATVTGPCTYIASNGGQGQFQTLSAQNAVGFYNGRIFASSDAARRLNAPSAVKSQNLASKNPSDWVSLGSTTTTTGHPDPFGGNRAIRVLNPDGAGNHGTVIVYSNVGTVAAGEIMIAGAWTKPSLVGSTNNIILEQVTGGIQQDSSRVTSDNNDWEWEVFYIVGVAEASDTVELFLSAGQPIAGSYVDYYGLTFIRLSGGLLPSELGETMNHFGPYPYGAPAGSIAPNGDLAIGDRLVSFRESLQAGDAPTLTAGANVGSGPTLTPGAGNTDVRGTVSITTGTGSGAGALGVVTFAANRGAFASTPVVLLTPTNSNAAGLQWWASAAAGSFTVETKNAPVDGTLYTWNYQVIG